MSILPRTAYCPECGADWQADAESHAGNCCGVPLVDGYLCPDCGIGWPNEGDAIACWNWDCTPEGYRLIHAAAKAAGQTDLDL